MTYLTSNKLLAATITALVSGMNIASAMAMEAPIVAQRPSQDPIVLSKQDTQKDTVFSPEMLAIEFDLKQDSETTSLIPGQYEDNSSEYDGFKYAFN